MSEKNDNKLDFIGNKGGGKRTFEPSIKEYTPKNGDNPNSLANLMMEEKISAADAKALKEKATEVMNILKEAGHPTNVTYQAYESKQNPGQIGYKLSVKGRDSQEGELQAVDMTLDKSMKITKAYATVTEQENGGWKTRVLKGNERNDFVKNALRDLKDLLPEMPKRELPPFVKEIADKIREASPTIQNDKGEDVSKYYTKLVPFKDKQGNDRTNLEVNTHGDEKLTITLNKDLDGITQIKYSDYRMYQALTDDEKKAPDAAKNNIKNIILNADNLEEIRDNFLHDTVIGDILLSKDNKALENEDKSVDQDFMNIPDMDIDEEIPFE